MTPLTGLGKVKGAGAIVLVGCRHGIVFEKCNDKTADFDC